LLVGLLAGTFVAELLGIDIVIADKEPRVRIELHDGPRVSLRPAAKSE
jgi:hypothetical protein